MQPLGDPALLPADFAQRVMGIARRKLDRRRIRNRIAGICAVALLIAAMPLVNIVRQRKANVAADGVADVAFGQWRQDALAYQLAQVMSPRSAGDCLLPDASAVARFDSAYNNVVWQDDFRSIFYR